jgi:1-acyl-sn-glycerol-3-phosphate acyltransferase
MTAEVQYNTKYSTVNEYKTDPQKYPSRTFPSLIFFSNLARIMVYNNRFARKGIYNNERWSNSSADVLESLQRSGVRFHFEGLDNYKKVDGPMIFVGNHMSTFETMALPCMIQPDRSVVYVIKEELATYPVFGPIAMARYPILVGRENPREDLKAVLEQGSDRLKNGKSIIIFPQKTRTVMFDASSFNSLGVKLAKKNNVPVIPVAIYSEAWGNGKFIKEVGKIDTSREIRVCFGEPMMIKGNGAEEHQAVIDFIAGKFKEWGLNKLIVGPE